MSSSALMVEGRQSPSVEHLPHEIATSARGDEAVELASLAGLELDPWQAYVLRTSLSQQSDEMWSAFLVGLVVGRQNGKGSILEARELAGLFLPGVDEHLILHSAHEFKTCYEHFLRITQLIESCPDLDRLVAKVRRGVGEQAVELRNGNRLRFIARSGGSGRGMSAPCVVLDEAYALTEAQIGAIMPTLSAQPNPQLWYTSSAPMSSSVALHRLRDQAMAGTGERLFYAEWGNDPGVEPDDVDAIARANPALGRRIFMDFIETEHEAMSPEEFARERLGIPEMPLAVDASRPIPLDLWGSLAQQSSIGSNFAWSLTVSDDRKWATIGIAGRRGDELFHVEVGDNRPTTQQHGDDSSLIDRCVAVWEQEQVPVRIHSTAPEGSYIAALRERGVDVDEISTAEVARNTGQLIDAANGRLLRHVGQRSLDVSLERADVKSSSSGAVTWVARSAGDDVSPLKAVSVALGGVAQGPDGAEEGWVFTT